MSEEKTVTPEESIELLSELLKDVPVKIGLSQQGHMATVARMLTEQVTETHEERWKRIGKAIGWYGPTAEDWWQVEAAHAFLKHESEIAELKAQLETAHETNTRLNRRAQLAEAGVRDTVENCRRAGLSLGRALANAAASLAQRDVDSLRATVRRLNRRAQHAESELTKERRQLRGLDTWKGRERRAELTVNECAMDAVAKAAANEARRKDS